MNYPAFQLLLQGYLTLDWPDDYSTMWAAVDDYIASEPGLDQLLKELDELIEAQPSDGWLRNLIVGELGSGYLPEVDRYTMMGWLVAVRERVRIAVKKQI